MERLPPRLRRVLAHPALRPREVVERVSLFRAFASAVKHFINDDGIVIAGYLAFTGIFAIFPFLIFLLSLAGSVGHTDAAQEMIRFALYFAPPEVASALAPAIDQIREASRPGLMTFGIVTALWVASSGLEAARHALVRAYGTAEEQRNFIVARLQSIAIVIVLATAVQVGVLAIVAGPFIRDLVDWMAQRQVFSQNLYVLARYGTGLLMFFAILMFMHLVLPGARLRARHVLPGVLLTVIAWAALAGLYSKYLRAMGGYNLTYGSLGGIILTLFFFYISAAIFIFGAQLNGALRRQRLRIFRSPPSTGR